jgi:hypothetical protein
MKRSMRAANAVLEWLYDYPPVLEAFMAWSLARSITPERLRRAQVSTDDDLTLSRDLAR